MLELPAMTDSTHHQPPFLLRRLAAMVYDTLLVLPLIMASVALFMGARTLLWGPAADDTAAQLDANIVRLVALVCTTGFFCAFWVKSGQTLGMQAWRIKLVSFSGATPNTRQGIMRCLGAVLSAACLGLGYLWCLVDRNGRYWHDYLSGTELILLPRSEKSKRNRDG
jgi:uncharacterized RDD family membrane protein YckC